MVGIVVGTVVGTVVGIVVGIVDRVGSRGLRPVSLPHHRTCGFPHPAVEIGGVMSPQSLMA